MDKLSNFEFRRIFYLSRLVHPDPPDHTLRRGTPAWQLYFDIYAWIGSPRDRGACDSDISIYTRRRHLQTVTVTLQLALLDHAA